MSRVSQGTQSLKAFVSMTENQRSYKTKLVFLVMQLCHFTTNLEFELQIANEQNRRLPCTSPSYKQDL